MTTLQALLDDGTRFHPTYLPSENSDHLPMTLCAMTGLGASVEQCIEYREVYKRRLHEAPAASGVEDWTSLLGRSDGFPPLLTTFRRMIAEQGMDPVVAAVLPALLPSLAMEAFHPVIRLGYALEFRSEPEAAAALAYFASTFRPTPVAIDKRTDLRAKLERQCADGPRSFGTQRFTGGLGELLQEGRYPVGRADSLQTCAALSLDLYRSTRNFFALHLVTASQAVRLCARLVDERLAVASLTGAILATHQIVGSPDFDRDRPAPMSEAFDDEHSYKYAWACLSELRFYGDTRYAEELRAMKAAGHIPAWCAEERDGPADRSAPLRWRSGDPAARQRA